MKNIFFETEGEEDSFQAGVLFGFGLAGIGFIIGELLKSWIHW